MGTSHYYEGRVRPPKAFGLIYRWAALGAMFPRVANFLTHAPVIPGLAKRLAGVEPQRPAPEFSHETFRGWQRRRNRHVAARSRADLRVVLWTDTFNDHFTPKTLAAALEVLEDAGCEVIIPEKKLCCGRPLYDLGMLDRAKALWRETFAVLGTEIARGTPIVGIEPSCIASFREELPNLFPGDALAQKLSKLAMTLDEYLGGLPDYRPPRLQGRAVVWGHFHHASVRQPDHEVKLLQAMGLKVDSIAAGEGMFLSAVRAAPDDALIVADGFSCRSQVEDGSDRRPLNLAEVLQLGLYSGSTQMRGLRPEATHDALVPNSLLGKPRVTRTHAVMAGGIALAAGALYLWWKRR